MLFSFQLQKSFMVKHLQLNNIPPFMLQMWNHKTVFSLLFHAQQCKVNLTLQYAHCVDISEQEIVCCSYRNSSKSVLVKLSILCQMPWEEQIPKLNTFQVLEAQFLKAYFKMHKQNGIKQAPVHTKFQVVHTYKNHKSLENIYKQVVFLQCKNLAM